MDGATCYADWQEAAQALDDATGLTAWREEDESPHYHATELREQTRTLNALPGAGDLAAIEDVLDHLHESLHRHHNDLLDPALYQSAHGGTKRVITGYLDAVEGVIERLVALEHPAFPTSKKLEVVQRAYRNLGRSALLLSGGATLGFYHLGVVKALFGAGLLPHVMSGASMGAMIAAGICGRTDDELRGLFDADVPDIERVGLEWRSPAEAIREGSLMRPERLLKTIEYNCGQYTFEEAFERSGRVLNISVAPTRARQKPRVLSHITAPRVWVASAALASSAVPGLFPPATLMRKARDGSSQPYVPGERWIDGSFGNDLPTMRIARLHNVNHFIVSQTQPYALPLLDGVGRRGWVGEAAESALSVLRSQGLPLVKATRKFASATPLRGPAELLHSIAEQQLTGDIDIHPRFEPRAYLRLLSNPSQDDLVWFIKEGERAAWPKLAMIRDATRIRRCLLRCQKQLQAQLSASAAP